MQMDYRASAICILEYELLSSLSYVSVVYSPIFPAGAVHLRRNGQVGTKQPTGVSGQNRRDSGIFPTTMHKSQITTQMSPLDRVKRRPKAIQPNIRLSILGISYDVLLCTYWRQGSRQLTKF